MFFFDDTVLCSYARLSAWFGSFYHCFSPQPEEDELVKFLETKIVLNNLLSFDRIPALRVRIAQHLQLQNALSFDDINDKIVIHKHFPQLEGDRVGHSAVRMGNSHGDDVMLGTLAPDGHLQLDAYIDRGGVSGR